MEFGIDGNWIHVTGLSTFTIVCDYAPTMFVSPPDSKDKINYIEWGPWHWNPRKRRLDGPTPKEFQAKILHYLRNKGRHNRKEAAKLWATIQRELRYFKLMREGVSYPYRDHLRIPTPYVGPYLPWDGWHITEGAFSFENDCKYGLIALPIGSSFPSFAIDQSNPIKEVIVTYNNAPQHLLPGEYRIVSGCALALEDIAALKGKKFGVTLTYLYWANNDGKWFI